MSVNLTGEFQKEKINWRELLSSGELMPLPTEWDQSKINPSANLRSGEPVLLFRSHKFHQADHSIDNLEIIYAAPNPIFNPQRLNAQKIYDLPERAHFITVYHATQGQKFFHDDQLESAKLNGIPGAEISSIEKFDPIEHFETNATGCDIEGIYLVIMPKDPGSPLSISVKKENARIFRIDNKPKLMQMLDEVIPPTNKGVAPDKPQPVSKL